jgi:Peptidase family M23
MRRLFLITATTALAFLVLAPPAWAEWVWPLRGEVITPYRNGTDPYASGQHRGIDIAGQPGTPVVAAAGGEVRFAAVAGSSGLTVSIRTADGRFDTSYLHLSSAAVREGDRVAAGERVGAVGTTGVRSAAAPHLHFGVRDAGSRHAYHDPLGFLPAAPASPQAPREAPAPRPSPVAPGPAPAPVPAPAPGRVPVQAPAGRRIPVRAPAGRRVPVRSPAGRRVPVRSPAGRRVPLQSPSGRRVPVGAPGLVPAPVRSPSGRHAPVRLPSGRLAPVRLPAEHGAPEHEPGGRGAPADDAGASNVPVGTRADRPEIVIAPRRPVGGVAPNRRAVAPGTHAPEVRAGSGPDWGLVLGCFGLVAAAALLGLTREGRETSRRTGRWAARTLRPLLGRR